MRKKSVEKKKKKNDFEDTLAPVIPLIIFPVLSIDPVLHFCGHVLYGSTVKMIRPKIRRVKDAHNVKTAKPGFYKV